MHHYNSHDVTEEKQTKQTQLKYFQKKKLGD